MRCKNPADEPSGRRNLFLLVVLLVAGVGFYLLTLGRMEEPAA
jgi:hypothetical protein